MNPYWDRKEFCSWLDSGNSMHDYYQSLCDEIKENRNKVQLALALTLLPIKQNKEIGITRNLSEEELIKREKHLYEQKKEKYLEKYEGKYVALVNNNVLDSDSDFSKLANRVYAKYGYRAIFMTRVTRDEKKHRMSPKFKNGKLA